jgi:hypothetical protein
MKKNQPLTMILSLTLSAATLVGCTALNTTQTTPPDTAGRTTKLSPAVTEVKSIADTVKYDSEDYSFDWKSQSYQTINVNTGSAEITKSGIYEITGTLNDGSLVVNVDKKADSGIVYLVLNNANLSSIASAPINIKDAKKVVILLEKGTTNTINQGSKVVVDADNEPSAAVFSKASLTITGSGTLQVVSDYNDGISSKDTLKITDGTIVVNAKADGIVGKDVLAVKKGNITITAGKDGVRSTNDTDAGKGNILIADGSISITSNNDAMEAFGTLQIDGGTLNLTTGGGYEKNTTVHSDKGPGGMDGGKRGFKGGNPNDASNPTGNNSGGTSNTTAQTAQVNSETESKKALKADGNILINNGTLTVSAYDDSVHAKGGIEFNGGTLTLESGDDGIHSDTHVTVNNGTISILHSYEGVEGKILTFNNGKIALTSTDDAFNVNDASGLLAINGGEIHLNSGGDGTDSNGAITMTGGVVYVDGPTANNNGAIDYDQSFKISGGTIIAAGSSGMAQSPDSTSNQPSILMYYGTTQIAGTSFTLKDSKNNSIVTYTPSKEYASVAISSPDLKKGESYTLYSGSTKVVSFTLSETVTYLNESGVTTNQSHGPGGGGMKGNRQGDKNPGGMPGGPGAPAAPAAPAAP